MAQRFFRTALMGLAIAAGPACAPLQAAGPSRDALWTLAVEGSDRSCSLSLHFNSAGAAGEVAMPAGCRRAVPALRQARAWSLDDNGQISFSSDSGQSLATFARQTDGSWRAVTPDGPALTLAPAGQAGVGTLPSGPDDPAAYNTIVTVAPQAIAEMPAADSQAIIKVASKAAPGGKAGGAEAGAAAGRYAVMRGERDTGCMVTLDHDARSRGSYKARLAPACRDQGITIFDPVGWQTKGGELVLTARKGHSINLDKDENGVWVKMPKDAKALGLKPL